MLEKGKITGNQHPLAILEGFVEKKDKVGLHAWIELTFGYRIPDKAITKGNNAPFDFVADYIFGEFDTALVLGNRTGGKTLCFAILDSIMAYLSPKTEICTVGAIQPQAQRGYEYFSTFSQMHPFNLNIKSTTMSKTKCKNGSMVQILTGTMSGVNSPHPQLLFLDEIDLMAWQILQQAFSMPQSKHGVRARTVMTSTRKFAGGVMQRMMTEADKRNIKVYQWNIWDVVAPLPKDNPALLKRIQKVFGNELPSNIDQANGFYDWEDLINKYQHLDDDVWETEWLCKRPGLQGVVYASSYSDDENLITEWTPPRGKGYLYLWEDFGFGKDHPNVVLPVYIPPEFDRAIIFDELYVEGYGIDDIWKATNDMLAPYGHKLPNVQEGIEGTITGWICDPSGLSEIHERKVRGAPIMDKAPDSKLYLLDNGIPIVRKFLNAGRVMITEKCVNLRTELLSYSYRKNADGTYSKIPLKTEDHGPDAMRYGLIRLGELIRKAWFGNMYSDPKEVAKSSQKAENIQEKTQKKGNNQKEPITAGFLDMKF